MRYRRTSPRERRCSVSRARAPRRNTERFHVTDRQGRTHPIWVLSPQAYQAIKGVHAPWIAEISPMQYAGLSGREKHAYDARRDREWQASADVKEEWKRLVVEAYKAGLFDPQSAQVSADARSAIAHAGIAERKAAAAASFEDLSRLNRITSPADAPVGSVVFHVVYNEYSKVLKHAGKRLRVRGARKGDEYSAPAGAFQILHYNELEAANEAGASSATDLRAIATKVYAAKATTPNPRCRHNPGAPWETLGMSRGDYHASMSYNEGMVDRFFRGARTRAHGGNLEKARKDLATGERLFRDFQRMYPNAVDRITGLQRQREKAVAEVEALAHTGVPVSNPHRHLGHDAHRNRSQYVYPCVRTQSNPASKHDIAQSVRVPTRHAQAGSVVQTGRNGWVLVEFKDGRMEWYPPDVVSRANPRAKSGRRTNPRAKSLEDVAILMREKLHRLDAAAVDMHRSGWAERHAKAHTYRLKLAAVNQQLGRGMAETTEAWRAWRRARGLK